MVTSERYRPAPGRNDRPLPIRRCGRSGIDLPVISLGMWQNFGGNDVFETGRAIIRQAFDRGITHFDLANNYGPPYGSAEETFGRVLDLDLRPHRDEIIVSTKAGYDMWPGLYGGPSGSRKHLVASLDQSLCRLGLDYVDIFYSHCPDPSTPLEETIGTLADLRRSGKALFVGISSYSAQQTRETAAVLADERTMLLCHQPYYSMLNRDIEADLLPTLQELGVGCITFSPLAQGLLTGKYLGGVPDDARAAKGGSLSTTVLTAAMLGRLRRLNDIADRRGQSLAQLAIAWVLRDPRVTSTIVGARTLQQLNDTLDAVHHLPISEEELNAIDDALATTENE